jgi:hypothetical protein
MTVIIWVEMTKRRWNSKEIALTTCLLIGIMSVYEWKTNHDWLTGQRNLNRLLGKYQGCVTLSKQESLETLESYAHLDWILPYNSIVANGKLEVDTVFFTQRHGYPFLQNPCLKNDGAKFIYRGEFDMQVVSGKNIKLPSYLFNSKN